MSKLSWIATLLCIIAKVLINFKSIWGMWIFAIAYICWVIYAVVRKEHALLSLNIVYIIITIVGLFMWS